MNNRFLLGIIVGVFIFLIWDWIKTLIIRNRIKRIQTEDEEVCSTDATVLYNNKTDEISWFDNSNTIKTMKDTDNDN